jgi:hypothetical protein
MSGIGLRLGWGLRVARDLRKKESWTGVPTSSNWLERLLLALRERDKFEPGMFSATPTLSLCTSSSSDSASERNARRQCQSDAQAHTHCASDSQCVERHGWSYAGVTLDAWSNVGNPCHATRRRARTEAKCSTCVRRWLQESKARKAACTHVHVCA